MLMRTYVTAQTFDENGLYVSYGYFVDNDWIEVSCLLIPGTWED